MATFDLARLPLAWRLNKSSCACCATAVAILYSAQLPVFSVHQTTWRDVARRANRELHKYEFAPAIDDYRRAISMLNESKPKSEALFDLKLALCESLRRDHKLQEAQAILDEVESDIIDSPRTDGLLTVRYWRRRAALQQSMKHNDEAGASYRKAFAQWTKLFPPDTRLYVDNAVHLLDTLLHAKAWTELAAQMVEFQSDGGRRPLSVRLKTKLTECSAHLQGEAERLCNDRKLAAAAQLMIPLSQVAEPSSELLDLWIMWLESCVERKEAPSFAAANTAIGELVNAMNRKGLLDAATAIKLRLAQFSIREQQKATSALTETELREVITWLEPLASKSLSGSNRRDLEQRHKVFVALHRAALSRFDRSLFDDLTLKVSQCEAMVTPSPAELPPDDPFFKSIASDHADARYLLTLIHVRRKDPVAAEKALSTLSPVVARTHRESYYERVCRLHIRIAWEYFKKSQFKDARRHYELAESCLKSLSPGFIRVPIQTLMDELAARLKEQSAQSFNFTSPSQDQRGQRN